MIFRVAVIQIRGELKLGFYLEQRTSCLGQKKTKTVVRKAAMPFRDIARNGHCGATQLRGQSVDFLSRKSPRHLINIAGENHGFLPHLEISVAPSSSAGSL